MDPAVTAQRIYMYFYFAINLGSFGGIATVALEHTVGFWAAYLLPLCAFFVAFGVLVWGRKKYIVRRPDSTVILDSFKAMGIAARNGWKLDAAKPSRRPNVKWDDQFIDELKRALVACKVFLISHKGLT